MKKVIRASQIFGHTDKVNRLLEELEYFGVSEHTICQHFLDYFSSDELVAALEDLKVDLEIDDEDYE